MPNSQFVCLAAVVMQDGDRMAKKQRIEGEQAVSIGFCSAACCYMVGLLTQCFAGTAQSVYNVQAQAYGQVQPGR